MSSEELSSSGDLNIKREGKSFSSNVCLQGRLRAWSCSHERLGDNEHSTSRNRTTGCSSPVERMQRGVKPPEELSLSRSQLGAHSRCNAGVRNLECEGLRRRGGEREAERERGRGKGRRGEKQSEKGGWGWGMGGGGKCGVLSDEWE